MWYTHSHLYVLYLQTHIYEYFTHGDEVTAIDRNKHVQGLRLSYQYGCEYRR